MPISNIPIFSMLRTRMQWHQERQRLLAENVSNADTPKFQARDLAPLKLDPARRPGPPSALALMRTEETHLAASPATLTAFQLASRGGFDIRPTGNAVSLEDEMLKVANNQMDFQAATALYARGVGLIKSALGRR
jgi:flagellar basal-body rod protein FlgB